MIKIYKKDSSKEKIKVLEDFEENSLVDCFKVNDEELNYICSKLRIDKDDLKDVLEREKPSIGSKRNFTFVVFDVPVKKDDEFLISRIFFVVKGRFLIIFRNEELDFLKNFYEGKFINLNTKLRVRFIFLVIDEIINSFSRYLENIVKLKDSLEKELFKTIDNEKIMKLLEIGRILLNFESSLIENNGVIKEISKGRFLKIYENDKYILDEISIDIEEALRLLDIHSNTLSNSLDAFASIVSNNLSQVVKILTALSLIVMVPTLLASYYGMNVSLPFQEDKNAFNYILLISLVISLLIFFVFKYKKWL